MLKNVLYILNFLFLFSYSQNREINNDAFDLAKTSGFLENKGQIKNSLSSNILFKTELPNADVYITSKGISYLFLSQEKRGDSIVDKYERLDIELKDANIDQKNCKKTGESLSQFNFFYTHCANGIYGIKQFDELVFKDIYPSIDWRIVLTKEGLKYDFVVKPGADVKQIKLVYRSLKSVVLENNNLIVNLNNSKFSEQAPFSFLELSKIEIRTNFNIEKTIKKVVSGNTFYETQVGFMVGNYMKSETLIIDPLQLVWGTYFGGNKSSIGNSIATDQTGNVFVLGTTNNLDLPTQQYGSLAYFQGTYGGNNNGGIIGDLFLLKFNNTGQLLWSTYFGGSNYDVGVDLKIDSKGDVFVLGKTTSVDFPLKNAGASSYFDNTNGISDWASDFLLAKFSNSGQYLWGTYYGSNDNEYPYALSVDASDNVFFVGHTIASDFPLFNPGGGAFFQGTFNLGIADGVILKFSNSGQRLLATYFGGSSSDEIWTVASDPLGNTYFGFKTGSPNLVTINPGGGAFYQATMNAFSNGDGYLLKLNSNCQAVWATYFGSLSGFCTSLACDRLGNLFMMGRFNSGFPTVDPGGGAFFLANSLQTNMVLAKFNPTSQMIWSTYFGTWGTSGFGRLHMGSCNELYATVSVASNCGTCPPMQTLNPGNGAYFNGTYNNVQNTSYSDQFIAAFTNSGIQRWGTYFGGDGQENTMFIASDNNGNLFYTGEQGSAYYFTSANFASYTSSCIINPGNGAYFQPLPIGTNTTGVRQSCVIGKFIGPKPISSFVTSGCGSANSATIIPAYWGPYTYTWSTGSSTTNINNVNIGVYTYTLNDAHFGCSETRTVFLGLPALTITPVSNHTAFCLGDSTIITANGANTFSWTPNIAISATSGNSIIASPSVTTTYTLTGFNSPTCSDDTVITLKVFPLPIISIAGQDSICNGSSINLTASGAVNYTWSPPIGISIPNSYSVIANPIQTQTYNIIGKDGNSCFDSTRFILNVILKPQIQLAGNFSVCARKTATIDATGADQFYWIAGSNLSVVNPTQVNITPTINTIYKIVAVNANLCKDSLLYQISVYADPPLSIVAPDSACINMEFKLQALGSGTISWTSTNHLNCNSCQEITSIMDQSSYYYTTITDSNSCRNYDSIYVRATDYCDDDLIIPNIFTPNNDGANDEFYIRSSKNVKEFSLTIYNRWGIKLFESNQIAKRWDGYNTSGIKVTDGVYFYVLTAKLLSGRIINKGGNITVAN